MRSKLLALATAGAFAIGLTAGPAGAGGSVTIDPTAATAPATVTVTVTAPACQPPMAAALFQTGAQVSQDAFVQGNGPALALPVPAGTPPGGYQVVVFCSDPDTGALLAFAEIPFTVLAPADALVPPIDPLSPAPPVSATPAFTG